MFSYLRYFFITSIVVVLVGAVLFGWYYRRTAESIIKDVVEQNNVALAKSFHNTIWKDTLPALMEKYFYTMSPAERMGYKEFVDFSDHVRALLKDMEVVEFNIYTSDGVKLLSARRDQILKSSYDPAFNINGNDNTKLTVASIITSNSNEPQSEMIYDAEFTKPLGNKAKGVLIRTLIPLRADNSPDNVVSFDPAQNNANEQQASAPKPELVLEIYFDVTKNANSLRDYQWISTILILSIFVILYLALIITSRRAEKIIEKQHETNVDLAAAKASAENENQQKSQFLSNISHELRTPLNAIIGFSEIIKDEVMGELNNEQYKNYIRDIHSSGVFLLSLINDILDYSKAEAGKLDIEYEDIDLTKVITSSLRLQEPRAKSAEVTLLKELPDDHLVIRSDAKRLRQVLLNILSNAVKFTPAGGSVKISAWRNLQDNNNVTIEVKDTGIGIAPKDIAKALAPFGQVDSELSRRYEGTGLGLPLTKKFVELLGGQLKLSSELNKGTTVTVLLPVNNDANSLAPKNAPPKQQLL